MQRDELRKVFSNHGLLLLGLVDLLEEPAFENFRSWLQDGRHAAMQFLERNQHIRADPRNLLEGGRQALVFALPYYQGDRLQPARRGAYKIAQYARLQDYHRSMRKKAESILDALMKVQPALQGRVTIDSAPLLERALAARTAEGFIGKNTCYIHPRWGSFFLLGEILLDRKWAEADQPAQVNEESRAAAGGCGTCRRCQVYCPTGALDKDFSLDARKCLAYWTIEHRDTIPFEFWNWMKTYVFGCDICQLACPYNKHSPLTQEAIRVDPASYSLFDIAVMTQAQYVAWFGGTPLTRAKRSGLRRNALIALTVSEDPRLPEALAGISSEDEPVLHDTKQMIRQWQQKISERL